MNNLQRSLPGINPEPRSFDFFLDRLEPVFVRKGRGFSLFQADLACVTDFSEQCERRGLRPFTIQLSSVQTGAGDLPASPFVIVVQDLSYAEFMERAAVIADRIIFPLWFRRIPICFFSWLGHASYEAQPIKGEDLHNDFPRVIRALLAEQVLTLLERSNIQVEAPELLSPGGPAPKFLCTPIEEKMRAGLEAHELSYQPQVRLGRQTVDFLVGVQGKQVIVECENRAYPELYKDSGRDAPRAQALPVGSLSGYPVCRFSASEIESDLDKCIRTVQEAVHYRTLPAHQMDDDLDPSQREAVASVSGPIRVLAPAGSGKTKTLVNRILYLLNQGVAAEKILALAFNKKARDEMQDRLERRGVEGVQVRTFHSFGYEIVREGSGWTFGGPTQKKTAKALMRSAIQEHTGLPPLRNQDPVDAFLDGLRRAKMELPALSTVTVEYGDKLYPLEPIFHSYIKQQAKASFMDFDDMIYLAVRLLLEKSSLRRTYQSRFEFVLVDEFQDLNEAQLLLLQIIALPENNIFAVGDDDQMIYGFRGADVKHIVEFEKRFPVASSRVLDTNYRSSRMIVRHANWLIGHNRDRVSKDIQPRREAQPGQFEVAGGTSLLEQATFAANWLREHKQHNKLNWRDYAVLYRYNAYQFPVALMLDALGIPHSPVAAQQLFQTPVGLDVYSYLQVVLFPREAKASDFERILKRPNRYLTNQLIAQAKEWTSFLQLPLLTTLRDWERQSLADFIVRIERFTHTARLPGISAADYLQMLKTEFGLGEFYREQARITDDLDQASDDGLLDVMIALAGNYKTPLEFFQFICKSIGDQTGDSEKDAGNGANAPERDEAGDNEVFLSTIHRAKGKEFRNVIYFNLSQSAADPKAANSQQAAFVEEERRVTYVGATRAKDDLLITFASTKPSEFLWEIALNPTYRNVDDDDLGRGLTSAELHLERARVVLKQLEADRQDKIGFFRELTKTQSGQGSAWPLLRWVLHKIQLWRIDRALARVESIQAQIKTHKQETIAPLERELQALEEEGKMRRRLLEQPVLQAPSVDPTGTLHSPQRMVPDPKGTVPNPTGTVRGEKEYSKQMTSHDEFEYDVALSFAGEDKATADKFADLLKRKDMKVFYDQYEPAAMWGKDLVDHLVNLYARKARYCVLLLSQHYPLKKWTETERMSAQERAFRDANEYILPILLEDVEVPGITETTGYRDLRQHSMESIVNGLEQKLIKTKSRSGPPSPSHDLRSGNIHSTEHKSDVQ
jgi:superfamily I DNA/RNA helicase/very-short-patch-repair endonuclease